MNSVGVELRNIALAYGQTAVLRDITLEIRPGEFFALLGPSGSGKTTLLRLIAGFNQHQKGELRVDGKDMTGTPPWDRNIGMVFQNYALWPHMSVARNVAFGLEERRLPREKIREKVAAVLELVGLAEFASRRPGQLSGGQQQRVALARTLAIEPQVLLLDEPLSNLDAKLRVQTRQELKKLQRRLAITTIFVTHDQEEALTTCDRIAVMDQGVIQQVGTPMELFDHPVNRFVAGFVGSVNVFPGAVRECAGRLLWESAPLGSAALPAGVRPPAEGNDLAFRPHAVRMLPAPAAMQDTDFALEGRIESFEFLGEFVRYEVRVGTALVTADIHHARGLAPFARDTPVVLGVPGPEIRFIGA